jgi:hypothetical protein
MNDADLLTQAWSRWGKEALGKRKVQLDFSSEKQRERGLKFVEKRQGSKMYETQFQEVFKIEISKSKSVNLLWEDTEEGKDRTLNIPLTGNIKLQCRNRMFVVTEAGFELQTYKEGEEEQPLVFSRQKFLSLHDGIYINRLWELKLSRINGFNLPARKTYQPPTPGASLPTIDQLKHLHHFENNSNADSLSILQNYVSNAAANTSVITMVPELKQKSYSTKYNNMLDNTINFHQSVI